MMQSMTGFAQGQLYLKDVEYVIDIKSLNSKGFEFIYKSPLIMRTMELDLKKISQEQLIRGKIDAYIYPKDRNRGIETINEVWFEAQYAQVKKLAERVGSTADVFSLVLEKYASQSDNLDLELEDKTKIQTAFQATLNELIQYRNREGNATFLVIQNSINQISKDLQSIEELEKNRSTQKRDKLLVGIEEITASNDIDYNRLGQEVIYYIEKLDISEEINRLKQHIELFINTSNDSTSQGKKLGFIAQEIGREINTIGSKANDASLQHLVVNMKDQLEQIKEQLNNIV